MALNMRTPALALLATLAVAGFQHREQLGRILGDVLGRRDGAPGGSQSGRSGASGTVLDGVLGNIGDLLAGKPTVSGSTGSMIRDGLDGLLDRFRQTGHAEDAESWVKDGPNRQIDAAALEEALGADVIAQLKARTGLSREELLHRLSTNLPKAVDGLTPEGRLPTEEEAAGFSSYRTQ